ncbi:Mth938-like domain-containing protein [Desulfobacca acetoxidans]|uniref:Uncharacterized protein n=1 Tax=Desulfobacca acetoxidans (strain ATCC 700848 / DSM 11109 / ASRB2) TaxID=880072 RepID=F2NCF7_DESAR|nr:Mth938-like domain-containing protein [Desulfobacca acetoxidans]AEB09021.1 protein of unknown function DUF498 [Desulfobacca acetoxidans DSM 11109]HAY22086.1 hypothetical protein [Desulfobacterales bacterium]
MRIDSYEFGRIVVEGQSFSQDIILLPDGIQDSWWRQESHLVQLQDVAAALASKPEVFIVGQGQPGKMRVDEALKQYLRQNQIELLEMPTKTACATYNELSPRRKVVAALHLTC